MHKSILDALDRLTTPGPQTSEGKGTKSMIISFVVVIGLSLVQGYLQINPTGATAQIVGGIIAMIIASNGYAKSRTAVKEQIGGIIQLPAVQDLLKEMSAPTAKRAEPETVKLPLSEILASLPRPADLQSAPPSKLPHPQPRHADLQSAPPSEPAPRSIKIQPRALANMPTESELESTAANLAKVAGPGQFIVSVKRPGDNQFARQVFTAQPAKATMAFNQHLATMPAQTEVHLTGPGEPLPI